MGDPIRTCSVCGAPFRSRNRKRRNCSESCYATYRARHGHAIRRTPTYASWQSMLYRCKAPKYKYYSQRGITVCDRWRTFENFLADMGERPDGTTLDRRDNDKGYEPGNCRWSTPAEQSRNARGLRLTHDLVREIRGRREHGEPGPSIAARLGVARAVVNAVLAGRTWVGVE